MPRGKQKIAVIDFETDPFLHGRKPYPFAWGFYDGDHYEEYFCEHVGGGFDEDRELCGELSVGSIVSFLRDYDGDGCIVYAHNGGKFDYYYLVQFLDEDIQMVNGRLDGCYLGQHELRDSWRILPLPLAAHQKDEIDYKLFEIETRTKPLVQKEIRRYLKSDCVYLYDWVQKFITRFGLQRTIAGTAFKELRKTGYKIPSVSEHFDEKIRPFYFGGRTEAFKSGKFQGDYDYVDINSAYPYAMTFLHPRGDSHSVTTELPDSGSYFVEFDGIADGCLPYRGDDGLTFPRDGKVRRYFATHWEVVAGLDTHSLEIKKIHQCICFHDVEHFRDYVYKFYEEKKKAKAAGDKDNELFAKLLLNSCYGRFGMNPLNFKEYALAVVGESPLQGDSEYAWQFVGDSDIADKSLFERPRPGDRFYNVATAASITGFVRAYLWRAIYQATDVLYCDTDSLICQNFGGEMGDELGQWDLEDKLSDVYIAGKKLYAAKVAGSDKWKKANKGARLTIAQIRSIVEGGKFLWKNDAPAFSLRFGTRFVERELKKTG